MKLLLVTDNHESEQLEKALAQNTDWFQTLRKTALFNAPSIIREENPDLVVLECRLTSDNILLLPQIKKMDGNLQLLLLADSAEGISDNVSMIIEQNTDGFLVKPYENTELVSLLRRTLKTVAQQKDLKLQATTLRRLNDNMHDLISQADENGILQYVSPSHEKLLGYKPDGLLGKVVFDLIHPHDLPGVVMTFQNAIEQKTPGGMEYRIKHADGHYIWLETFGKVIEDDRNQVIGAVFVSRDVGERKQADEALHDHLQRFNLAVAGTGSGLWDWDIRTKKIYFSPEWKTLLGYADIEIEDTIEGWEKLCHPDDIAKIMAAMQNYLEGKISMFEVEHRLRSRNGVWRWVLSRGAIVRNKEGEPVRWSGINIDLTHIKETEHQLLVTKQQLSSVLETQQEMICRFLPDTTLTFVNEAYCRELGKTREELIGKKFLELIPEEEHQGVVDALSSLNAENPSHLYTHPVNLEDGSTKWHERNDHVILDALNNVIEFQSVGRDITKRKQAEEALRKLTEEQEATIKARTEDLVRVNRALKDEVAERKKAYNLLKINEKKFRTITENMNDVIWLRSADNTKMLYISPAYERLWGLSCQGLYENPQSFVEIVHPDDKALVYEAYQKHMAEGSNFDLNYRIIKADGKVVWVNAVSQPVTNEEGLTEFYVGRAADITPIKLAEEAVRAREEVLSSLYRFSRNMRTAKNCNDLLPVVLNEAVQQLQADDGMITMLAKDNTCCKIVVGHGYWADSVDFTYPVSEGTSSYVMQNSSTFVTDNFSITGQDVMLHHQEHAQRVGPMIIVPLKSDEGLVGALEVSRRLGPGIKPFTQSEIDHLSALGEIAGSALRRQALFEHTQDQLRHIQALHNIDNAINNSLDLEYIFKVVLDEITALFNTEATAILCLDQYSGHLYYETWRGFHFIDPGAIKIPPGKGLAGKALIEQKFIQIADLNAMSEPVPESEIEFLHKEEFVSYYAVPLMARGHVRGVLELFDRKSRIFNGELLEFLKALSGQVAVAIDNLQLFKNLEIKTLELLSAYDLTIEGWAFALDLKDEETEQHSRRVTEMTLEIARRMNIKEEDLLHIKRGALLHDIGKMGIPDSILLKPGKLTDDEWEAMRKHPLYAYEMLAPIEYLKPALDIPYCHHEKWDGSGYPRGLKGKAIPLAARIFAVADVYDALTSDRPYRKAWPKAKALELIKEESGKHFDPAVVDIFISVLQEKE